MDKIKSPKRHRKVSTFVRSMIILTAISILGLFSGSNEPIIWPLRGTFIEEITWHLHTGNSIIFNLSAGLITGIFLWLLVSWIPERRREKLLINNLARNYSYFKQNVIRIILSARGGRHEHDLADQLMDPLEFKKYFSGEGRQYWYAVLNGLQANQTLLNDVFVEIDLLSAEVSYALNNLQIADDSVHSYFKRLCQHIYRLKNSSVFNQDPVKYLETFLWETFAQWSQIRGDLDHDIFLEMLERI